MHLRQIEATSSRNLRVLNESGQFISGIILMLTLGLSVGNFATTFIYRVPRGLKIAKSPPYCECERRVKLEVRDNFPFFSWLLTRGKCRWCDIRIPALYALVELACGALFVTGLWRFGLGDELILVLALGVMLIVQFAIYYTERRLIPIIAIMTAGFGAMHRILLDASIFGFIQGAVLGIFCGAALWQARRVLGPQPSVPPSYVMLLGIAGGCVGKPGIGSLLLLSAFFWAVFRLFAQKDKNLKASAACLAISLATVGLLYDTDMLKRFIQP